MGKLEIRGYAATSVPYDRVQVQISFRACNDNSRSDCSKMVLLNCEDFLNVMEEAGIKSSSFKLVSDSVNEEYYRDGTQFTASRVISIDGPISIEFVNSVQTVLSDSEYNADLKVQYYRSDEEEIRQKLYLQALKNAKESANEIAGELGYKVTGLLTADKSVSAPIVGQVLTQADLDDVTGISNWVNQDVLSPDDLTIEVKLNTEWEIS